MSRNVILIAAIVVIAGYFYFNSQDKEEILQNLKSNNQEMSAEGETSASQSERGELIEKLFTEGVISKIDSQGDTPKVYVTADYIRIPDVDKKAIKEVLFENFKSENPNITSFEILDEKSGDLVSTYEGK